MIDIDIITWVIPIGISFLLTFLYIGYKIKTKNTLLLKRLKNHIQPYSNDKRFPLKGRGILTQEKIKSQNQKLSIV